MVYERFRAGCIEREADLDGPDYGSAMPGTGSRHGTGGQGDPLVRVAAGQGIQGRSILGPAGLLRYPSTSLLRATRLHTCYTARNRGRSAKSARSLLTELFRLYTGDST